jgi:Fe-S cluster biogenesis protein NfuA
METLNRTELEQKIEIALNSMRPFLQADGGDVELVDITDEMEVQLRLLGNCSSCSMSSMTMKAGIENGLKSAIPQITRVTAIV